MNIREHELRVESLQRKLAAARAALADARKAQRRGERERVGMVRGPDGFPAWAPRTDTPADSRR